MKYASPGLIALLNSGRRFHVAELFDFTLSTGEIYRYTSADTHIQFAGEWYIANGGPVIQRSNITSSIELEVCELQLTISATADMLISGHPWLVSARIGVLDGAMVSVRRVFMPTWGDTSLGAVTLFLGMVANVDVDSLAVHLTVKEWSDLLNVELPRNVYQPPCLHTVYDDGCGLFSAAFEVVNSVDASFGAPTTTIIPLAIAAPYIGYYQQGEARFTSGVNAGLSRTIKWNWFVNGIDVVPPLPAPPAHGDGLVLLPGCDKRHETCALKFANRPRFRGYPYIPVAETAQ